MASIDISDLANEINRQLRMYADGVGEKINESAKEIAKEGVKELKQTSPSGSRKKKKYKKSWKDKKVNGKYIVHNTEYRLTHLLEKSHATRDGGRTTAQPHIAPVERKMIQKFERAVREAVQDY